MSYRDRFYRYYTTTQVHSDSKMIRNDLKLRAPYIKGLIRRWILTDPNSRILDLGCGYGAILYYLKEAGYRDLEGIDRSPEQVAVAGELGLGFVQKGDVLQMLGKKRDGYYDVVISFDMLEHFTKDEILAVTDEVHRVLKKGGKWLVHVPNAEALFGSRIRYADFTHEQCFTQESIRQLMGVAGFERVECYEDVPVVHGLKSFLRRAIWKLSRLALRLYWSAETGSSGKDCIFTQNLFAVAVK